MTRRWRFELRSGPRRRALGNILEREFRPKDLLHGSHSINYDPAAIRYRGNTISPEPNCNMDLQGLAHNWNLLAEADPMWAVLMDPDRDLGRWDPGEFFETGLADVAFAMHAVRDLAYPLGRGRVLDFGCGLGRLTQALACYFDEVDGIDIAPAMVRQARQMNPYGARCRFHLNRHDDLSLFPDNQFDFVFSLIVLQHMPPEYIKRYVAEFLRVLAPGGLLLFGQPSHYCRQPIDHDYLTRGDRFRLWLGGIRKRLARGGKPRARPPLDDSIITPKHERREPILDSFHPSLRVDRAVDGSPQPHAPARSSDVAITELHLIPRRKMLAHIKRLGGRVIHVAHRADVTPHHANYRYFVTK